MARERKTLNDAIMTRFVADPSSVQADQPAKAVALTAIQLPEKRQPRRYFDPEKMAKLVTSVQKHGILEPILVRPLREGHYELIAGERRFRAAQAAGLAQVPVVSREFSDQEALQVALIENLQRDDLNPIEETEAVLELLAMTLEITVEEVKSVIYQAANAKNRGRKLRESVAFQVGEIESCLAELGRFNLESLRSSRLPLLNLPPNILAAMREGKLEYTKARTISRVKDDQQRNDLLEQAIAQSLSLIEIRTQIKALEPDLEKQSEQVFVDRMTEITKRLKKNKAWNERKKRNRIVKLLDELERLTES
jgi:ParB family chromosome partitioning protein